MAFPIITAQEAAEYVKHGDNLGISGFTAAGTPKVVPAAIAEKAEREHAAGREFKVNLFTGASTNDATDGALTRANAIDKRTPYQGSPDLRAGANKQQVNYFDLHLSELAQKIRQGVYGKIDVAIIEAQSVSDEGEIVLGTGVGNIPTLATLAEKIIVEVNDQIPAEIRGLHDIYVPLDPPYRREIPIYTASDRIGSPVLKVDPKKILGVVKTSASIGGGAFSPVDDKTMRIGNFVCDFLLGEMKAGRIPKTFLPLQSGVGNIANAVLASLEANPEVPVFEMYTEVVQDAVVNLLLSGKCKFASSSSMTFSNDANKLFFDNIDKLGDKLLLRPCEISNHPEVVRRLGVISMNTAIEADIFGNVNSTHVSGTKMMNGIGGSGDFTRNAYISIFSCPSESKAGAISNIVPMVSHLDHSEHSVDIVITDQGIADLRGKSPIQRAKEVIENCAHPDYRPLLREYLALAKGGHTPHTLQSAYAFHTALAAEGTMKAAKF